jgi:hypothetical protein
MKLTGKTRVLLFAITLGVCMNALAQDSSPSLGDLARKTRKARGPAQPAGTEDDDGPDFGGVWHLRSCVQTPCYEISVTLPKSAKWTRTTSEPRPVLIALPGHDDDPSHAIRVYAAEAIPRTYAMDSGTRMFLQVWFARPEYFGQSARIVLKQNLVLAGRSATTAHFTVTSGLLKYRGLSVVANSFSTDFGFACVFREEDSAIASSICDAVIASASTQLMQPTVRRYYPPYQPPPAYYYPLTEEPQEDDDPE